MDNLYNEILNISTKLDNLKIQSNCLKRQVGAILYNIKKHKIVSQGFNTTATSYSPCVEMNCCSKHITGNCPVIHAEPYTIYNYLLNGNIEFEDVVLICTYSPCYECSKLLAFFGIKEVYFQHKHHRTDFNFLDKVGIKYNEILIIEDTKVNEESNINRY